MTYDVAFATGRGARVGSGGVGIERRGTCPGIVGDVKDHPIGSVALGLVERLQVGQAPSETFGTELLQLFNAEGDVVHPQAEVMNAVRSSCWRAPHFERRLR
jgi:hypothetical protein